MKDFDLYPISTLIMICSRKGYILYDRYRDKNRGKRKRPAGGSNPDRAWNNTQEKYTTKDGKDASENADAPVTVHRHRRT